MIEQRTSISLQGIISLLGQSQLDDALDFQRNVVWTNKNRKRLIETWKNKRPYGTITWCRDRPNDRWGILDGKQRLTTLIDFAKNQFTDQEGKTFKEWSPMDAARFLQHSVGIHQLTLELGEDHSDFIVVFEELNNAGIKVSDSELIAAGHTPIVQYMENFFMTPITNDDNNPENQLKTRWCSLFRNRLHYTKKLKKVEDNDAGLLGLTSICIALDLDTQGTNAELEERIRARPMALALMNIELDKKNDSKLPASVETRKRGYGPLTAFVQSSMLGNIDAISTSFKKLKENGLSEFVTEDRKEAFHKVMNHYLKFIELVRNIQNIPVKYALGFPKVGYLNVQKFALCLCIIIEAMKEDEKVTEADSEFHQQCIHLFNQGNFGPLLSFYAMLAQNSNNLCCRFEAVGPTSNNMNKAKLSSKIGFIHTETR